MAFTIIRNVIIFLIWSDFENRKNEKKEPFWFPIKLESVVVIICLHNVLNKGLPKSEWLLEGTSDVACCFETLLS